MTSKELLTEIRFLLLKKGVTNTELAKKLEISRPAIGARLNANDCTFSKFCDIVYSGGIDEQVFVDGWNDTYSAAICNNKKEIARNMGRDSASLIRLIISDNIKLSNFIAICEAGGIYNQVFKIV